METVDFSRCIKATVPVVGVEVLTVQLHDGSYLVCVHGGRLDGDRYPAGRSEALALRRHEAVEKMAFGA